MPQTPDAQFPKTHKLSALAPYSPFPPARSALRLGRESGTVNQFDRFEKHVA